MLTSTASLLLLLAGSISASAVATPQSAPANPFYTGRLTVHRILNPPDNTKTEKTGCVDQGGLYDSTMRNCGDFELILDGEKLLVILKPKRDPARQCRLIVGGSLSGVMYCDESSNVVESLMQMQGDTISSTFDIISGDKRMPGTNHFTMMDTGSLQEPYIQSNAIGKYVIKTMR